MTEIWVTAKIKVTDMIACSADNLNKVDRNFRTIGNNTKGCLEHFLYKLYTAVTYSTMSASTRGSICTDGRLVCHPSLVMHRHISLPHVKHATKCAYLLITAPNILSSASI